MRRNSSSPVTNPTNNNTNNDAAAAGCDEALPLAVLWTLPSVCLTGGPAADMGEYVRLPGALNGAPVFGREGEGGHERLLFCTGSSWVVSASLKTSARPTLRVPAGATGGLGAGGAWRVWEAKPRLWSPCPAMASAAPADASRRPTGTALFFGADGTPAGEIEAPALLRPLEVARRLGHRLQDALQLFIAGLPQLEQRGQPAPAAHEPLRSHLLWLQADLQALKRAKKKPYAEFCKPGKAYQLEELLSECLGADRADLVDADVADCVFLGAEPQPAWARVTALAVKLCRLVGTLQGAGAEAQSALDSFVAAAKRWQAAIEAQLADSLCFLQRILEVLEGGVRVALGHASLEELRGVRAGLQPLLACVGKNASKVAAAYGSPAAKIKALAAFHRDLDKASRAHFTEAAAAAFCASHGLEALVAAAGDAPDSLTTALAKETSSRALKLLALVGSPPGAMFNIQALRQLAGFPAMPSEAGSAGGQSSSRPGSPARTPSSPRPASARSPMRRSSSLAAPAKTPLVEGETAKEQARKQTAAKGQLDTAKALARQAATQVQGLADDAAALQTRGCDLEAQQAALAALVQQQGKLIGEYQDTVRRLLGKIEEQRSTIEQLSAAVNDVQV